jgi:hypothetical protein
MACYLIGYGKSVLGSVTTSFTVTIKLNVSHSLPVAFRTTARHVIELEVRGPVPRNSGIDWPHGYKATEPPVHDGAVFHQWLFHVRGYHGRFKIVLSQRWPTPLT